MKRRNQVKAEEDAERATEHARRAQLKKEIYKRMSHPGAIADLVKAQVIHLGFTPQEVYAEMLRQSSAIRY